MAQSGEESVIPVESDEARDERIRKLFRQLDVNGTAKLTRSDLKQGFQRINHPLQNADSFIDQVMRAADVNQDGVIEVPPPRWPPWTGACLHLDVCADVSSITNSKHS
jgi:EF-hand domain pair